MSVTPRQLLAVAETLQLTPSLSALRARFPALHFTACSDDEIAPQHRPAFATDEHALYLVAGGGGQCPAITDDFAAATGVVVAARADAA
ncbi:MAG: hypothetical protein HYU78_06495 [Rhodocyclales bacterium]|nr:hypothetical protein [Rhodocyclales bacterium]